MKTMLFFAATILVSQMTFAATSSEVISDYESGRNVTCHFTNSSSWQTCVNGNCWNKEYYTCGDVRLVLDVHRVIYPDGSSDETAHISDGSF